MTLETLENASTIEKESLKEKAKKQQKKKSKNIRIYRSFLTIVLLLCILQMAKSTIINISKVIIYQEKIHKSLELKEKAKEENQSLEDNVKVNNSMDQIESIARNNLKMAAKDEVLIIINQSDEDAIASKDMQSNGFVRFLETFASKFNRDMVSDKTID